MTEEPITTAAEAARRLQATFQRILETRMEGVPILNPALAV